MMGLVQSWLFRFVQGACNSGVAAPGRSRGPGGRLLPLAMFGLAGLVSTGALAQELTARSVVAAHSEATISVEMSARVKKLGFRPGDAFKRGDLLVDFDCGKYRAELRAKQAAYQARKVEFTNNRRLLRHQAIGASEVAVSKARLREADALVKGQEAVVSQCSLVAPYDGAMVEWLINEHETSKPAQPLLRIVNTSQMELQLIVPSKWLVWLKRGTKFTVKIDETGVRLSARVVRLGAVVGAVSQTIKITGEFEAKNKSVLPGMSGTATFNYSGS